MSIRMMTEEVVDWINPLLPEENRDPMNTAIKMVEEVSELIHAMHTGDGNVGEECADILILLLDIAHLNGIDLENKFWAKMTMNRNRTWVKKNGSMSHEKML